MWRCGDRGMRKLPRHEMHAIEACASCRVLSHKPWGGRRRKGCVPRSNVGRLQEQLRQSKTGTGDATVSPCIAGSARYPEHESSQPTTLNTYPNTAVTTSRVSGRRLWA